MDIDLSVYTDEELWELYLKDRISLDHDWSKLIEIVPERVRDIIIGIVTDVNHQLSAKRSEMDALQQECIHEGPTGKARYFEAKGEYDEWRVSAIRFKRLLELRSTQLKRVCNDRRRDRHADLTGVAAGQHRELVRRLAMAIVAHQQACSTDGLQPSRADMKLWGILDRLTVGHAAQQVTLTNMIDLVWFDEDDEPSP